MTRTFKHLVSLFVLLCLCAHTCADDFSTDPDLATDWTQYVFYSGDLVTTTWNGTDGDLDLVRPAGQSGIGLSRTGSSRTATDPVTLTVKELKRTDGTWGFVGLMISAVEQPGYITTEDDTYTLRMAPTGPTTFNFQVTRTYLDGTSDYVLYQGADETFSGPYVLDIERDGDNYVFLVNGTALYTTGNAAGDLYDTAARDTMVYYQIVMAGDGAMTSTVDDFGLATRELASTPNPEDAGVDVLRNVVLTWQPGEFAVTHNVYFGTSFGDVNAASADVLVGDGQDANSLDLGRLALGQTYYWRVDEVNGAPDKTIFKGNVWSFEVEPVAIPIENVTVTASSSNADDMGPANTINGIGLNELDQHSTEPTDMWLSGMGDPNPSIQYEFDKA